MCSVGSARWTWIACFAAVLKQAYTFRNISDQPIADIRFLRFLRPDGRQCGVRQPAVRRPNQQLLSSFWHGFAAHTLLCATA